MNTAWLDEVLSIISSQNFVTWLEDFQLLRRNLRNHKERYEELLTQVNLLDFRVELANRRAIERLEDASRLDDTSINFENLASTVENTSFEVVSQFEEQRDLTTHIWENLGALEESILTTQDSVLRKNMQLERLLLSEQYELEIRIKQRLWVEVERLWAEGLRANLILSEMRNKGSFVRKQAEGLFERFEQDALLADKLRLKSELKKEQLDQSYSDRKVQYKKAEKMFKCILHEDFLYWLAKENNKSVYLVPLLDDKLNYNLPIFAGEVYKAPIDQGVQALEKIDLEQEIGYSIP